MYTLRQAGRPSHRRSRHCSDVLRVRNQGTSLLGRKRSVCLHNPALESVEAGVCSSVSDWAVGIWKLRSAENPFGEFAIQISNPLANEAVPKNASEPSGSMSWKPCLRFLPAAKPRSQLNLN